MRRIDGTFPPPELLKALRAHARGRPYTRRRLTRKQLDTLPLSQIVEIGSAEDIEVARRARWPLRPGGFASSRPSLKHLLVLAAIFDKRDGKDVRSIAAKLREMEEDLERRVAELRRQRAEEGDDEAGWHGKHLTEDEIVADMLAKINADPKALEKWTN